MGRPRLYENDAARVAAYRAKVGRLDITVSKELETTLNQMALDLNVTRNDLCVSLFKFALTNRDWKKLGLTSHGKK